MAKPTALQSKEMAYIFDSTHSIGSFKGKPKTHVDNIMASTHSLTWSGSQMHLAHVEKDSSIVVVADDGREVTVPQVSIYF